MSIDKHLRILCNNVLNLFLQCFSEIDDLLELLIDEAEVIPELFSMAGESSFYKGYLRWKRWATSNQLSEEVIFPDKPFYLFFSVFRRSTHMFFIFEYDIKNFEVSFSI